MRLFHKRRGGDYLSNFSINQIGKKLRLNKKLAEITKEEGYEKALESFYEKKPELIVTKIIRK